MADRIATPAARFNGSRECQHALFAKRDAPVITYPDRDARGSVGPEEFAIMAQRAAATLQDGPL